MDHRHQTRSPNFKAKVAIEALKSEETLIEIATKYNVHPKQVAKWRDQLLEQSDELFIHKSSLKSSKDPEVDGLLKKIGQLTLEIDFLKKKLGR
jgi:transposase-like protein